MKYVCDYCGKSFDNKEACDSHEHECGDLCRLVELTVDLADNTYGWSVLSVTADYVSDEGLFISVLEDVSSADKRRLALAEYHAAMTQKEQKQKLLRYALESEEDKLKNIKATISILEQARSKLEGNQ